jgi:hypothetical protein
MFYKIQWLILEIVLIAYVNCSNYNENEFIGEWAAKVSDSIEADLIAHETGFINKGLVSQT